MSAKTDLAAATARWRSDIVLFIEECLHDPETRSPFRLYAEQKTFLRHGLELTPEGKMKFTELVFSSGKKAGKTALAAMVGIYTALFLSPLRGEIYCIANDLEQSQSRVFKAIASILEASPLLRRTARITASRIEFRSTGTTIYAIANDFAGHAGASPTLSILDESCYFVSESSHRLWSESIPIPTRKISFRLSVSTAGFEGEPSPLRELYDRAMQYGTEIAPGLYEHTNMLLFWSHRPDLAPWQSRQWIDEMATSLRPAQFQRLIENRWVASASTFVELSEWDSCVDETVAPISADKSLRVWIGLDLGARHDSTAIVAVTLDGDNRVVLVDHKVFTPAPGETLDFESTAEASIRSLAERFSVQAVCYDPWQGLFLSQRLGRSEINMVKLDQVPSNQGPAASVLIDLIRQRRLVMYKSAELRLAVTKTVVLESSRGYRLGKIKGSDRVDPIIALSFACLIASREEAVGSDFVITELFGDTVYYDSRHPNQCPQGMLMQRSRPPSFTPMARPESELDPDAPRHPGVTFWDFVDQFGYSPQDPIIPERHAQALAQYKRDMQAYREKKAAAKAAAVDANDAVDLVRS